MTRIDPCGRLIRAAVFVAALLGLAVAQAQTQAQAQAQGATPLPPGLRLVGSVEGIREYRLDNGLQVLVAPDDSKPTTTVNLTYRVGSRHENYGETGMAHLLEHLIFKGTPKHPNVWAEFDKRGFRANGSTWFDRTNYFASFAAGDDNLRWFLAWHADAMVNSFIAQKDLDSEMTVVRNEMEMGENNPTQVSYQRLLSSLYDWHNYGNDTIGNRSDVENVDIRRLQAFYRLYYQPDNATLIVTGKFDPARTLRWIGESFGKIARPKRALPRLYTVEPVQDGERSVQVRRVGGTPLLFVGYHAVAGSNPDFAAVATLAELLADAPSGRLHKRLVEAKLAASVAPVAFSLHDPGWFGFLVQLAPEQKLEPAREELIRTLETLATEPITAEELARAKTKARNAWDKAFANPEGVGVALSEAIAAGDWRFFFLDRDRVAKLTLDDVNRVAKAYLLASNRSLVSYLPTEAPQRAPAQPALDIAAQFKGWTPAAELAAVEAFDPSPANIDARTQRARIEPGLELALLPKPTRGKVASAQLTLRFGNEQSLKGQGAVPSMLAAMLDKGSATLSRQQVADRLDALRTQMRIGGEDGVVTVSLNAERDTLPQAIALVADLLRNPSLPPEALEELRAQSLAAIEEQRREPEAMVSNAVERHGNPYPRGDVRHAANFDEQVEDTRAVTVEAMRRFHQRFYGAGRAEFSAVGDFDPAAVRQALQAGFGGWVGSEPYTRVPQPPHAVPPTTLMLPAPDKQNAFMLLRQAALPVSDGHPDYAALMVANQVIGGGGTSRLWKRIRETEGLSYGVGSQVQWSQHEPNSSFYGYAIFAPQVRTKVEAAFRQELERALKSGFTAAEVDEAKKGLLSQRRLSRAQDSVLAGALANNLNLGRTYATSQKVDEALAALTLEQANAALRKYIDPKAFVWGFGGDFK
ncbi:M16 family metallopeptidase [Rivibacter subsaxonicus]|uniref:Zinc protease n=1 Tax=Rivibacter subsaxonicus TaxID=457575 RepID=A0A4Q7W1X6_9BURK|nr:pitrilysin family protein [Rivibacter subsaxonicus]RZU03073.1 zinc protease [Rivibacter subsaxonicus]